MRTMKAYFHANLPVALPFGATSHLEIRFVMKLLLAKSTVGHINCQNVLKSAAAAAAAAAALFLHRDV